MPTFRAAPRRHLKVVPVGFQIGLRFISFFRRVFRWKIARAAPLSHRHPTQSKSLIWVVRCPWLVPRGHRFGQATFP